MLKETKKLILDTLFPIECLYCKKEGNWICHGCFSQINLLSSQKCPYCEKIISPKGKICPGCKMKFIKKNKLIPLDNLIVAAEYEKSELSKLVHYYKYNLIQALSIPLGELMRKSIVKNELPLPDFIIPVPLHKRRLRFRGFNQSELLARFLGENLSPGFPISVISDILIRKIYTVPQMKIKNYQERQKNITGIFSIALKGNELDSDLIKNKTILLVDDISTTGSTLFECAKILKTARAKKVFGAVIARQKIKEA